MGIALIFAFGKQNESRSRNGTQKVLLRIYAKNFSKQSNMMKKSDNVAPMRKIAIRVIELPAALKKQIANECPKCSIDTVRNALVLTNPRQGEQPDRIRRRAMELGGVEVTKFKWVRA